MASFNYYLKDATAKDEQPIYLRYNDRGRVNVKFYIGKKILPQNWDAKNQKARRTLDGFADFNSILTSRESELKTLCTQLEATNGAIDTDTLKERFNELLGRKTEAKDKFKTLVEFIEHHVKGLTDKRPNTLKQYNQTVRLLKDFETYSKKKVTFESVDLDFYTDYVEYLTFEKKFSPNWIGKNIKNIKLFMGEAMERELHTNISFKSKRFKALSEETESIYLNEVELETIYKHDFAKKPRLDHCRDLFMIGCWTGLRFSDFSQLKLNNVVSIDGVECFKVKTQKTKDIVVIPVHPTVKEILNKYAHTEKGLPRTISDQKMNEYLKDAAKDAELTENVTINKTRGAMKVETTTEKYKLVTTHTARRSFATNLFLSGFPAISIMKITGHKTEKSFMKYIKISQEENAKLLQLHWSANTKLKVV
jgi:integrase